MRFIRKPFRAYNFVPFLEIDDSEMAASRKINANYNKRFLLQWIPQNRVGHLTVLTQL